MGGPPATRSINYGRVHSLLCEEIRVQGGTSLWVAPTKSPASDGTARRLLHSLAAVPPDPPGGRSAPNLGDIVRIPELLELMTKEVYQLICIEVSGSCSRATALQLRPDFTRDGKTRRACSCTKWNQMCAGFSHMPPCATD